MIQCVKYIITIKSQTHYEGTTLDLVCKLNMSQWAYMQKVHLFLLSTECKGAFIVCCNRAELLMYRILSTTALCLASQCSSWHRDRNTTTATYRNAAAVDYERILTHAIYSPLVEYTKTAHTFTFWDYAKSYLYTNILFFIYRCEPIPLSSLATIHLVTFELDTDLLPLVLANKSYIVKANQGTTHTFNLMALQRQIEERFVRGRPKLCENIRRLVFRQELQDATIFQKLRKNVPQVCIVEPRSCIVLHVIWKWVKGIFHSAISPSPTLLLPLFFPS